MSEKNTARPPRRMGHGPGRGMMPGEKPKNFKGTISKLLRYIGRYKYAMLVAVLLAAASTIFNIAGPKVLSKAITELYSGLVARVAGT